MLIRKSAGLFSVDGGKVRWEIGKVITLEITRWGEMKTRAEVLEVLRREENRAGTIVSRKYFCIWQEAPGKERKLKSINGKHLTGSVRHGMGGVR